MAEKCHLKRKDLTRNRFEPVITSERNQTSESGWKRKFFLKKHFRSGIGSKY